MHATIDVATPMTGEAEALVRAGVRTVIRYYNHRDVSIKGKCLTKAEARALAGAGLSLATVFEQRGGAPNLGEHTPHISDLTAAKGDRDARRALELASRIGQPEGSAIYFAVDFDFVAAGDLASITDYFDAARRRLDGGYRVGVYGSGIVCRRVIDTGKADLAWLAQSTDWNGYASFVASNHWALLQQRLQQWPGQRFSYDGNRENPALPDFGQFRPLGMATAPTRPIPPVDRTRQASPVLRVTARAGLNLRRGPGTGFDIVTTLPNGTVIHGLGRDASGDWLRADLDGDGAADGYVFAGYLETLTGAFPVTHPAGSSPYRIACRELADRPQPATGPDPRIPLYQSSTDHGDNDAIPWASSFVNHCVEAAGFAGTGSRAARTWHDQAWGADTTENPVEGDIAVYERSWIDASGAERTGGHVGFVTALDDAHLHLLGANGHNRLSIAAFPRGNGRIGDHSLSLRSVRRPPS